MSIDAGAEALPGNNRRVARRNVEGDVSPGLRKHITQAAEKIRGAHAAELADALKADRAGRLFSSLIASKGRESLAGELGGLLSDAIRAGTGLLEGSLTVLAQAWTTTVVPGEPSQPRRSAELQVPNTAVDTAAPGDQASQIPAPQITASQIPASQITASQITASSSDELMLREVLRQFMPMLLTAVNQGGDGYGLAKTVIGLFGRPTYDQASRLGKDKIMQLVRSEPDLWTQVAPIEARFSRFLDEFTGYGDAV